MDECIKLIKEFRSMIRFIREEDFGAVLMDNRTQLYYVNETVSKILKDLIETDEEDIHRMLKEKYNEEMIMKLTNLIKEYVTLLKKPHSIEDNYEFVAQKTLFSKNQFLKNPLVVSLQIMDTCNFKCIHCYTKSGSDNKNIISFEQIKMIVNQLKEMNIFRIGITGGEPLLHPDICKIVKYISDSGINVVINCNGFFLTEEMCINLKNSGLDHIHFSIDGVKGTNNYIRGNDKAYDKAIQSLDMALKLGLRPEIYFTCMKPNINELEDIIQIAKDKKVVILVKRFIPMGRGKDNSKYVLDKKEYEKMLKVIKNSQLKLKYSELIHIDDCYPSNNSGSRNCIINNKVIMSINAKGDVYTCPYIQEDKFLLGNVFKEQIKEIYEKISESILANIREKDLPEKCQKCEEIKACFGGCRAYSYGTSNDLFGFDELCLK